MKRKIYDEFLVWKNEDARNYALMIDGARRIGKSYVAEEFAKNEYESYILIDFNIAGKEVSDLFDFYLNNLHAFFWLKDSGVMTPCYNNTEPSLGLKMNKERTTMKCFMADTGLLISHTFDENGIISEELYKKLMLDKLAVNFGNFMENIVAQMLTANGHALYFYTNSSRTDAESRMEIDFLVGKSTITNKHNISPLKIKSGKSYTLSSIKKFCKKYSDQLNEAFVFHEVEVKVEGGITYLPLFMIICL